MGYLPKGLLLSYAYCFFSQMRQEHVQQTFKMHLCPVLPRGICVCSTCDDQPYALVCGDNDVTYANECYMKRTICLENKEIRLVKRGPCGM